MSQGRALSKTVDSREFGAGRGYCRRLASCGCRAENARTSPCLRRSSARRRAEVEKPGRVPPLVLGPAAAATATRCASPAR